MNVRFYMIITLLVVIGVASCRNKEDLIIVPISKEFNQKYISGQGLNSRYFNKNEVMQYYEVSNYDAFQGIQLLKKLNAFIKSQYRLSQKDSINSLTVLFYKKRLFTNYADGLVESARNNEYRSLDGHRDDLLARAEYSRTKLNRDKAVYWLLVYMQNGRSISQKDTVSLP